MGATSDIHVLQFVSGKYEGEQYALLRDAVHLTGRSSESDLVLKDDAVSRKHVRFSHHRGRVWLTDLGSSNGTHVNGRKAMRHCLEKGDRIAIGASLIRVDLLPASQLSRANLRQNKKESASGQSMTGSLSDIPLTDVLQWLATSRKTGSLVVQGANVGSLSLREGQVYYARIEGSSVGPQKSLLRMLGWTEGTFSLDSALVEEVDDELTIPLDHLLMEAARIQDELAHLAERKTLPTSDVSLKLPSDAAWSTLDGPKLDMLHAVACGKKWSEILDFLEEDDVVLSTRIVELAGAGFVTYE
jgi:pSer/pThr/pTyr-binding forkhead associated (FHA) protein